MRKRNVVSFIVTYVVIVLIVVLGSYLLYRPISNKLRANLNSDSSMQLAIQKVNSLSTTDEVKEAYEVYNNEVENTYQVINKSLSNMLLLSLITLSLSLIILGFTLFYTSRRNQGVYVALISSGFTVILFTIWFIYQTVNII